MRISLKDRPKRRSSGKRTQSFRYSFPGLALLVTIGSNVLVISSSIKFKLVLEGAFKGPLL